MSTGITRERVKGYFEACISRNPARIGSYLDDDVTWSCFGPIDLLEFCGQRRGKAVVVDAIVRLAPAVIRATGMELEEVVIEDDRVATFMRISAVHLATGRTVSYRCAQFMRFRNDKLVEFRALIDSLDAAEQVLGHPIEVAPQPTRPNVFAI
jgi:ketosteroid isomerase-like protein